MTPKEVGRPRNRPIGTLPAGPLFLSVDEEQHNESRISIHDGPFGPYSHGRVPEPGQDRRDAPRGDFERSRRIGQPQPQGGLGGLLGNLGGAGVGGVLGGGLNELVERFRQNGQGDVAESWVGPGPNKEVAPNQLEQAIGPDVLATLSQQTGLSREEILARLSRELPTAVDRYTPEGRLPTQQDVSRWG